MNQLMKFNGGVILLLPLFLSCSHQRENIEDTKDLRITLITASRAIRKSTFANLADLQQKAFEPASQYKAAIWLPKAILAQSYTNEIIAYLEMVSSDIRNSDEHLVSDSMVSAKDNLPQGQPLTPGTGGKAIFSMMTLYAKKLLSIDPEITKTFGRDAVFESLDGKKKSEKIDLNEVSTVRAALFMDNLLANLVLAENRVIAFCNNKVSDGGDFFTSYSVLVGLNSKYVQGGMPIEITAGVGAFQTRTQQHIYINGKLVDLDETGLAVYSLRSPNKPGKYSIPVKIDYIDQDGKKITVQKNLEYTVAGDMKTDH